jgi:hypothetical protein
MTTETVKIPTLDQLRATASSLGFTMGDTELAAQLECPPSLTRAHRDGVRRQRKIPSGPGM